MAVLLLVCAPVALARTVRGDSRANRLKGAAGADRLFGLGGADSL
jgi:hypothetical protein